MNNQIVLNALKSQLVEKKNNKDKYMTEVYGPNAEAIRLDILNWFRTNVSPKVPNIKASDYSIEIIRADEPNSGWGACTIYMEHDYRNPGKKSVKMNWYGSSARLEDENTLLDVEVFGAVASKFGIISYEYINNWYKLFQDLNNPLEDMGSEIHAIERSLRQVESDIRTLEIDKYKQQGFQCTLNNKLVCARNWEDEERQFELKEETHSIKLSTGRSNYDYAWISDFKVIKSDRYKASIEVVEDKGKPTERVRVYEASAKKFNDFIEDVYDWQNGGSEKEAKQSQERYERYTKVEA